MNRIVQGENLEVLRGLKAESAALIYVDPPFNTGRRQVRPRLKTIRVGPLKASAQGQP